MAVFRADASGLLGGGHVMRCLAIARALSDAGWHCGFACNEEAADVIDWWEDFDFLPVPDGADAPNFPS